MASMLLLAMLACSSSEPALNGPEEFVDLIEVHDCFDFRGKRAFQQLIFYRWSNYHRRFQVVDTVVVTDASMLPSRSRQVWTCRWKEAGGVRTVRSRSLRRTRSNSDPEVPEREYLPMELRIGLKLPLPKPVRSPNPNGAGKGRSRRVGAALPKVGKSPSGKERSTSGQPGQLSPPRSLVHQEFDQATILQTGNDRALKRVSVRPPKPSRLLKF